MRKVLSLFLALFLITIALCSGIVYWRTLHNKHSAEAALSDARMLIVGVSAFADAQRLSDQYDRYLKHSPQSCNQNQCDLFFSFDNKWLNATKLAPGTLFTISIAVKDDKVRCVALLMSNDRGGKVYVEQFPSGARISAYQIEGKIQTVPPWHSDLIAVRFTPDASSVQKDSALGLNLDCLAKLRGCRDAEEMLPKAYAELKARRQADSR
jgi:hypothetical protein